MAELLFWPALVAYGEAAVAYFGATRSSARLATWGVRVGWLAQTALLAVQAARADGFPWGSWGGSLNLFVWLVVGAYLIWGCRPSYRLLGLVVTPLAAALFALAGAGGGTRSTVESSYPSLFLVLHVGLVLVGFAGFTIAAGLSAVYLWQERRLKRRVAGVLSLQAPALASLDALAGRTVLVALPALTLGILVGLVRLDRDGSGFDALMGVTLVTWAVYGVYLALRATGWRGRRAAHLALLGFALVLLERLALPHF